MAELLTRDGKVIPGPGTWELAQKPRPFVMPEDTVKRKHIPSLKHLARPLNAKKERICWEVTIKYGGKTYRGQKKFYDRDYNNDPDSALAAAKEYRDQKLKEYDLPAVVVE